MEEWASAVPEAHPMRTSRRRLGIGRRWPSRRDAQRQGAAGWCDSTTRNRRSGRCWRGCARGDVGREGAGEKREHSAISRHNICTSTLADRWGLLAQDCAYYAVPSMLQKMSSGRNVDRSVRLPTREAKEVVMTSAVA